MSSDYIDRANDVLAGIAEPPLSIDEYVEAVLEDPSVAAQSAKYLLAAIESCGTRTVIEEGEEKERYRFFDDPYGDGEHAVLGNTDILNEFVDDLRRIASDEGDNEKIAWFGGPTATGKSELKRCFINGLRGYSRTDEGRRYTMEWNIATYSDGSGDGMTYGSSPVGSTQEWYRSPVNANPLSVFPKEVRDAILADANEDETPPVSVEADIDPFCKEAYEFLETNCADDGVDDLFERITDDDHLRIVRHTVDVGDGIGILHSEDDGSPKERLVGNWMPGMLQELGSRGRKNPQAFSYDGVLSQGNGLLTIVEDASQHADLLQKLLNIPEERMVKLDKKIAMDIDTVMIALSNPDLEAKLSQHADKMGADPLKALRRRLDQYRFRYLTNLSSEVELIHRELTGDRTIWEATGDALDDRVCEPLAVHGTEFAPHAIETAGLYSVVTRLVSSDLPKRLDLVDKARLFDRGYHLENNERIDISEFALDEDAPDGELGVPVTYTKDVLADLAQEQDVVMPHDVLDAMVDGISEDPLFSDGEVETFESRESVVSEHIHEKLERDVLDAMLRDKVADEATVAEYIEMVYEWDAADADDTDPEDAEFEPLRMKVFETDFLGLDDENYSGSDPKSKVKKFRRQKIIQPLGPHVWNSRGDDFQVDELPLKEAPVLKSLLEERDWDTVLNEYPNFDPDEWREPPEGTETEALKAQTLANMVEMFGYSEESALQASVRVTDAVSLDDTPEPAITAADGDS